MELVPENLGGTVIFNLISSCSIKKATCASCSDFAVAIHNWLINSPLKYAIFDLQDEKEVCPSFLEEILLLAKRSRIPVLFSGVMDKPKFLLESYDFLTKYPLFMTPEDASIWLKKNRPELTKIPFESFNKLQFGVAIVQSPVQMNLEREIPEAEAS